MKEKRELKFDKAIYRLCDRYLFEIVCGMVFVLTVFIRIRLAPVTMLSADYNEQLLAWVDHYKELGVAGGLSQKVGNYYIPYNFFLAVVSVLPGQPWLWIALLSGVFEYITAIYIYKLIVCFGDNSALCHRIATVISLVTLILPITIMNGALWKQCDSIYGCLVIMTIYYTVSERYGIGFIIYAIAFTIKLQAIFLLPFLLILYVVKKNFSILYFLWIPAMYVLAGIPAILCGRSITNTYGTYFKQMGQDNAMFINYPNIYAFGMCDYPALHIVAICVMICIFALMLLFVRKATMTSSDLLYLAAWTVWTCNMFLPNMRERYDYIAIILVTVYVLAYRHNIIWIAVIMNITGAITYSNYLFSSYADTIPIKYLAVPYVLSYFYMTYDFIKMIKSKNEDKCKILLE